MAEVRFLAVAFPVLLGLVFAMGAQFYYPFKRFAALFAISCIPAVEWAKLAGLADGSHRRG